MSFVSEFKEFAVKGNVVDMAVGIIIGGAFGKIVASFVGDVIMPVVGKATGGVSFVDKFMVLGEGTFDTLKAAKDAGVPVLAYGNFIQTVLDFLIVALCIFTMITWMNKLKREEPPAPEEEPPTPEDIQLLREIRDALATPRAKK